MPLRTWHLAMWLQIAPNINIPSFFSRDVFKAAIKINSELTASSWCSYRRDSWTIICCKKSFCIYPSFGLLKEPQELFSSSALQLLQYCAFFHQILCSCFCFYTYIFRIYLLLLQFLPEKELSPVPLAYRLSQRCTGCIIVSIAQVHFLFHFCLFLTYF